MNKRLLITAITLLLCTCVQSEMITLSGNQVLGSGKLTVNYDLTFTITMNDSSSVFFVFDEVVSSDGTDTTTSFEGLEYSINGGQRFSLTHWRDCFRYSPTGDLTENDGYIYSSTSQTLAINDVVTLHAGTGSMTWFEGGFNPWESGDYKVFIMGSGANKISTDAVPEPASVMMLALGSLVVTGYRRVRKSYGL